jgi:hypothetical protein
MFPSSSYVDFRFMTGMVRGVFLSCGRVAVLVVLGAKTYDRNGIITVAVAYDYHRRRKVAGDLRPEQFHGVAEAHPLDFNQEVYGVTGCAVIPAYPKMLFDDDFTGCFGQDIVVVWTWHKPVAKALKDRFKRGLASRADLRLLP